ncbi:MAG: hypothetical protein ABR608_08295 [Pseudonocardiaceae bacterium]
MSGCAQAAAPDELQLVDGCLGGDEVTQRSHFPTFGYRRSVTPQ